MPREIRLGLVGYGSDPREAGRGRTLLKMVVSHMEGIKAAGICDINPNAREMAGKDFPGVPVTGDFEKMLAECPMDALLIETPAHLHAHFAIKALQSNIHVLSDIPCVRTLE